MAARRNCTAHAMKRLTMEYKKLLETPDPWFRAHWDEDNDDILTCYFAFKGSPGSPYEGGIYVGRILMSPSYPFKPPEISMYTPNGRFLTRTRLCLSFSDYHPESWNAGWNIKNMVLGIQSFMMDESDPSTAGGIRDSYNSRVRFARESHAFNRKLPVYMRYFSDFADETDKKVEKRPAKLVEEPTEKRRQS